MGIADGFSVGFPADPTSVGRDGKPKIKFVLPVPANLANSITQFFGPTDEPLDGPWGGHAHFNKGIDWASPDGKSFPVYAAADGKVIWAGWDGSWGNSIKVQIADGRIVTYNHLSRIDVKVGDTVSAGVPIGMAGTTGASTAVHLSFDIFEPDGKTPVDPSEYFGTNLARDNRRGGSSGGSYFDTPPQVGLRQRQQLQSQRDYLFRLRDKLVEQDPGGNAPAIAELTKLITQIDQALWEIDTYGYAGYEEWAKQALDAKIRLGDLELRKASQLFTEWLNRNAAAFQATASQLASGAERNKAIDESLANYGKTRMALPRVYTVSPTFDEAYERWKKEFNVGPPPTLTEAVNTNINVPLSSPASWAGQGDPFSVAWGQVAPPDNPLITNHSRPPLNSPPSKPDDSDKIVKQPTPAKRVVPPSRKVWVFDRDKKRWVLKDPDEVPASAGPFRRPPPGRVPAPSTTPFRRPAPGTIPPPATTPTQPPPLGWSGSYAQGGKNIPGGLVTVGEQGPEHIVTPDGQVVPVGQQGPQTALVPDGVDILPANIPPEQAYLYAKLKQLMQEDLATREARKMAEAEQRRKDPNFEQKFREAVARAAAALLAADPPPTPQLVGEGWTYDPFYYERQLTGVGPDGVPLAQSQMQLPPDPRRQARMDQIQMEQQMQGVQA